MAAGPDSKRSILLNGGVDNRSLPELVAPLVQQGESPKLVKSTNTRLSKVPGTCARAPKFTRIVQFAPGTKRWGIIPSKLAKNAITPGGVSNSTYYLPGDGGAVGDTSPGEGKDFLIYQDAYVPARIAAAGALDALPVETHVAIGHNSATGIVWRAYPYFRQFGVSLFPILYVSAWSLDGVELLPPAFVVSTPSTVIRWAGITNHGATGDRIWYANTSGICYRTLALAGRTLALGPEVVVTTAGQPLAGIDVISTGGNHVYLAHAQSGSTTGATLRRVDITTGTTTHSVNIAGALAGGGKSAVHYGNLNGSERVAVAFSRVTGAKTSAALYTGTLSVVGAPFDLDRNGDVAVGFVDDASLSSHRVLVLVSTTEGDFTTIAGSPTGFLGTTAYTVAASAWGTAAQTTEFPWLILQSHCVHWQRGADQFPIYFLGRSYGNVGNTPGGAHYVDDPSVTAYLWGSFEPRPVARFGVVRGNIAPAYTAAQPCLASRSCFLAGDQFTLAYRKLPQTFEARTTSTGRYVVVDMAPNQPPVAHDKDGCALFAAAAPAQFDGERFAEIGGPYHAPKIIAKSAGGNNPAPTGVYRFAVVYEWTDNAGDIHRSRPSNLVVLSITTITSPIYAIYVTTQDSFNSSTFGATFALFYASDRTGKGLHLVDKVPVTSTSGYASTTFNSEADAANPLIYSTGSDGEELVPQPAPPLRDIQVIGPRAWGIDGEIPTRLVPSKLRVAGVGYEFSPFLEVNLPSDAGEALAVREWQGLAVVLCERGVYQIAGDGPNNNLTAGEFSQPIKLSDIGCSNTASAVAFPGGVIWQSGQRFAMLAAGGVGFMSDFNCLYDVSHALLLRRYEEIALLSNTTAEARVYNYSVGRWTTWDSQVLEGAITAAALLPYDEDMAFVYSEATGFVYRLDVDSVSPCANMTWEIDWTLLGGDFQDHVLIRDVVLNGTILGPHSITMELYLDYDESAPSTVRSWTHADQGAGPTLVRGLSSFAVGGRYTVRFEPQEISCRALKLKVYDTVATAEVDRRGVQPRALTVVYTVDGILREEVFVEGSYK